MLDLDTFIQVADLLTHYALDLVMTEWSNTKVMGLAIEQGRRRLSTSSQREEAADRELGRLGPICLLAYALPLR